DNGFNGVARLLMERGGNPHLWDVYGRTALYIAVGNTGPGAAGPGGPGAGGPGGPGAPRGGAPRAAGPAPAARGGQPQAAGAAPGAAGQGRAAAGQGARGGGQGGPGAGRGPAIDSGPAVSPVEMINLLLAAGVDTNAQLNMRRPSNQGGRFSDP